MRMLVHMATGLGKTRTMVALVKALLDYALAKRVLFVVDRRTLAKQAINKGFKFLSPTYNSHWITSANWRAHKNKNIHAVVIDTLELLYDKIPSNFYDLIIVDECHRSITVNRNLVFDHFVCPRIGLTATPKIAVPADGTPVDDEDLAINDTYRVFGCESGTADYTFGLDRGIEEGFLAPYRKEEHITALTKESVLRRIKDAFVANLASQGTVDVDAIFANPICARLIGSVEDLNKRFDGNLKEIVLGMQGAFKKPA